MNTRATQLVLSAFMDTILHHPHPVIFHSDNSSEYDSALFIGVLETVGVLISRSALQDVHGRNGYQESFYDKFKIDLGDWTRFKTLAELALAVYQTI